jgi:DNA-binding transcriptional regulator YiaG
MSDADARETRTEHFATRTNPFHFEDCGLPNIYLAGIRYFKYASGRVTPEIPAVKQLMQLIARILISKRIALTGNEIRFLRKRLGERQNAFARSVGIEPETLSRAENGHQILSESNDKVIRLYYAWSALDDPHLNELRLSLRKTLAEWQKAKQNQPPKKTVVKVTNDEWEIQVA